MRKSGVCSVTEEVTAITEIYEVSASHSNTTAIIAQVVAERNTYIYIYVLETYTESSKKNVGIIKNYY
jgi:hypothetical protein